MKTLSRRSVAAGIGAAVAAIPALALPAGATEGMSSELAKLIEVHRAAWRAFGKAIDIEQETESAYQDANRQEVVVPCLLGGVAFSVRLGRDFCVENIDREFAREVDHLKRLARVAPDLAEQARATLSAKRDENLTLLDTLLEEEEARKEAFGLAATERTLLEAGDDDEAALDAVLTYRCRTPEETRAKAEYLLSTADVNDTWDESAKMFLESFV